MNAQSETLLLAGILRVPLHHTWSIEPSLSGYGETNTRLKKLNQTQVAYDSTLNVRFLS
jgi:hypothetical protein